MFADDIKVDVKQKDINKLVAVSHNFLQDLQNLK